MRTKKALSAGVVVMALLAACGGPEPGSQEDLRARLDAIGLPASLVELDHHYNTSCPPPCPSIVIWYEVIGPLEQMRSELVGAMTAAGWDVHEPAAGWLHVARSEDHILYLVVDPARIAANNAYAPPGAKVEIVLGTLRDPTG